jgi:hypothetical protein
MAKEINNLLANDHEREMMRFKGYQYSRSMLWKEVAKSHLNLIATVKDRKPLDNTQETSIKYNKMFNEYSCSKVKNFC